MLSNSLRKEWDSSFMRGENNILYPQTEVIKFLNRYVVKRNIDSTITPLITSSNSRLRCLDFACGGGIHALICNDFNIEAYGVDISTEAILLARKKAKASGHMDLVKRFSVIKNDQQKLSFSDNFFDIVIAESCLDSMPFEVAKLYFNELKRICSKYIYFSLISTTSELNEQKEIIIEAGHEKGTIQSYFDITKIEDLTDMSSKDLSSINLLTSTNPISKRIIDSRFYCVADISKRSYDV